MQNEEYCSKGTDVWKLGEPSTQGKRSDLIRVAEACRQSSTTLGSIASEFPVEFIKFNRGIERLLHYLQPRKQRDFKTSVFIYTGEPGAGKSKRARSEAEAFGTIYYKSRGRWWDGYTGEDSVIIDDYYGWLKYDELLKLFDRYPYRVETKGGSEIFNSRRIYVTSNVSYESWYKGEWYKEMQKEAIRRRITKHIMFIDMLTVTLIDNEINEIIE